MSAASIVQSLGGTSLHLVDDVGLPPDFDGYAPILLPHGEDAEPGPAVRWPGEFVFTAEGPGRRSVVAAELRLADQVVMRRDLPSPWAPRRRGDELVVSGVTFTATLRAKE